MLSFVFSRGEGTGKSKETRPVSDNTMLIIYEEQHHTLLYCFNPSLTKSFNHLFDSRILRRSSSELQLRLSYLHKILYTNGYCFKSSSLLCAVGLYTKYLDPQCLIVITELDLLRFTV